MISVWIEKGAGGAELLRSKLEGFLVLSEVEHYRSELHRLGNELRARAGRVRYLVDATEAPVQSAEVAEALAKVPPAIVLPDDRLAVLSGSALGHIQAQRMMRDDRERVFTSEYAARNWLLD